MGVSESEEKMVVGAHCRHLADPWRITFPDGRFGYFALYLLAVLAFVSE